MSDHQAPQKPLTIATNAHGNHQRMRPQRSFWQIILQPHRDKLQERMLTRCRTERPGQDVQPNASRGNRAPVAEGRRSSPCLLGTILHCVQVTLKSSRAFLGPDVSNGIKTIAQSILGQLSLDDSLLREGNDCGHARPHASRIADDLPSISPRLVDEAEEVSLERLPIKYEVEGNVDPQNCEQDGQPSMEDVLTTERSTEKTEGLLEVGDEQNDVLLALQLKGRNLILDSACPELTPHIVISPPGASDDWDAYWAAWTNRIDPQSDSNLVVPYEHCGSSPSASLPPMDGIEQSDACDTRHYAQYEQARTEEDKRWAHLFPTKPLKVFNRSNLMHTECDCVYLDNVIMAVRRHHFKAAVLTASLEAASFRKRWDLSEFLSQFERPFRWTDPAEPLLSLYSHHLGATIIDSATPYTTPHIVIQEPPPQSSYWLYENTAPSPQDCGFGYYLTVPSPFVINPAGIQDSDLQCLDATLERSCAASPFIEEIEPLTPEKLDFMDDSLPSCMAQLCDIVDREETESSSLQFNRVATLSGNMLVTGCEVHEYDTPDDDDNLPPFDEWYQGIANRSQT